jgi:hypothetical protein
MGAALRVLTGNHLQAKPERIALEELDHPLARVRRGQHSLEAASAGVRVPVHQQLAKTCRNHPHSSAALTKTASAWYVSSFRANANSG